MFKGIKKLFDPSYKELTRCEKIADKVIALAETYKAMSDEELKNQTNIFKERLQNGASLDDIMVEAFAVAREAGIKRRALLETTITPPRITSVTTPSRMVSVPSAFTITSHAAIAS